MSAVDRVGLHGGARVGLNNTSGKAVPHSVSSCVWKAVCTTKTALASLGKAECALLYAIPKQRHFKSPLCRLAY